MRRLPLGALAVLLVVLAGCQRLNYEKEATLDTSTDPLTFVIDGPQSELKINVKVVSDKPVNVCVVLEDDKEAVQSELMSRKKPAKALAGEEDKEKIDFDATIPAKKSCVVFVSKAKGTRGSANVTVNVKNK